MSSIPLPALNIRPPQEPDLGANVERLVALKSMLGQQQLQQQQIVGGQQENTLRNLQIQDQTTLRDSAKGLDWSDPDTFDKWIQNAQKNGVSPQTLSQLALQRATYKEQLAKTDQQTLATDKQRSDALLGHIDAIRKDPSQAQAQGQQILQSGLIKDPQQLAYVQGIASGQKTPTPEELDSFETGLQYHSTNVSQELEQRKAAQGAWKELGSLGVLVNTESGKIISPAGGVAATPAMLESKYVGIQQKKNEGQSLTADEQAFSKAYEKNKTLVPTMNFNLQNTVPGAAPGAPLSDKVIDALGAPNSQLKLADVLPPRAPESVRQAALNQILAKYPNYSSGDFALEQAVKKEFTSGDAAKSLTAFNTAIEHAKQLQNASDYLDNGNTIALNKIGNALGYQFGSDKTTNFNVIKNALTGEISKVFKGGGATDAEIEAVQGPFSSANSPAQLKGAINNAIQLMNSKRDALQQQYNSGVQGKPNFGNSQQNNGSDQTKPNITAPAGKSVVYDGNNTPHFVDSGKLKQFLADPKYKGWHE